MSNEKFEQAKRLYKKLDLVEAGIEVITYALAAAPEDAEKLILEAQKLQLEGEATLLEAELIKPDPGASGIAMPTPDQIKTIKSLTAEVEGLVADQAALSSAITGANKAMDTLNEINGGAARGPGPGL